MIDNIGLPYSGINLSYTNSAPIGSSDADILVALSEDHQPTDRYVHDMRLRLASEFPGVLFSFIPADIVTQILNFGLPAPIDVQVDRARPRGESTVRGRSSRAVSRRCPAWSTCACIRRSTSRCFTSTSIAHGPCRPGSHSATSRTTC